jgi:hypothetical protein
MNRAAKIAAACAVSALAFVGVSRAESIGMNSPTGIQTTLRAFSGDNFDVRRVCDNGDPDDIGGPTPLLAATFGTFR